MFLSQEAEVDPRGIGEQYEDQCQFGEPVNERVVEPEVGPAENGLANDQTEGGEDQRRRDDSIFQPLGD